MSRARPYLLSVLPEVSYNTAQLRGWHLKRTLPLIYRTGVVFTGLALFIAGCVATRSGELASAYWLLTAGFSILLGFAGVTHYRFSREQRDIYLEQMRKGRLPPGTTFTEFASQLSYWRFLVRTGPRREGDQ